MLFGWLFVFGIAPTAFAQSVEADEAYWEYGAGLGAVHFEHYPAANEFTNLALPFPTFQYRGKILRADDREGARAYIFKSSLATLELAGTALPALDSGTNEARRGMSNLPWLIALGPRLVTKFHGDFAASLGLFQAVSTDFMMTRFAGNILEAQLSYRWDFPTTYFTNLEAGESFGRLFYTVKAGSKEFLALYFEVSPIDTTPSRTAYNAQEGLLSHEMTYFQSFKSGRATLYVGGSLTSYGVSVNRESPLHKSDSNVSFLAGMTYVLGEASRPAVPEEETSGVMNRRRGRQER